MRPTKNLFSGKQNTDSKKVNLASKETDSSTFNNYKLHTRHHDHFIKLQ